MLADDAVNGTSKDQLMKVPDYTNETPINQANATESNTGSTAETTPKQGTETTTAHLMNQDIKTITGTRINQAGETIPGPADDCSNPSRLPFCEVSGLRRSARPKRFFYPTVSQVVQKDTGKRLRENTTAVNNSQVLEKKGSSTTIKTFDPKVDEETLCYASSDKDSEGEMSVTKKVKIYDRRQGCENVRDAAPMSSVQNDTDKGDHNEVCYTSSDQDVESEMLVAKKVNIYEGSELERDAASVSTEIKETDKDDGVLFDMDTLSQFPLESVLSPPSLNCNSVALNVDTCSSSQHKLNVTFTITAKEKDSSIEKINTPSDLEGDYVTQEFAGCHAGSGKCVSVSPKELTKPKASMEKVDSLLGVKHRPSEDQPWSSNVSRTKDQSATTQQHTLTVNIVHSSCQSEVVEELDVQRRADHTISNEEKHPAFCGFSTASGRQVRVSEAAMKQARKTLREIDAELNINSSVRASEKEKPSNETKNKQRASEKNVSILLDFHKVACIETKSGSGTLLRDSLDDPKINHRNEDDAVLPRSDFLDLKLREKSAHDCVHSPSYNSKKLEGIALQNADGIASKQIETCNDSLLEDLLNDCKRKRKDSVDTTREENEGMEEKGKLNSNKESKWKSFSSSSDDQDQGDQGIATGRCFGSTSINQPTSMMLSCDVFHTASGKSVSISEAALTKGEKVTDVLPSLERKNVNGFHKVPSRAVENSKSYLTVGKRNVNQIKEHMSFDGVNKPAANSSSFMGFQTADGKAVEITEGALQAAKDAVKAIGDELFTESQSKSRAHSPSLSGFKTAFHEADKNIEGILKAKRDVTKEVEKSVSEEGQGNRVSNFSTFSGCQTAGVRKVIFSEEALKTGKDIKRRLAEDPSREHLDEKNETSLSISNAAGFHLADTNNVSLSRLDCEKERRHALRNANSRRDEICKEMHKSSGFAGFQTASGKRVEMSEEALKEVLLENEICFTDHLDNSLEQQDRKKDANIIKMAGFQTAAGKNLMLSEDALRKGAEIMQGIGKLIQNSEDKTGVLDLQSATVNNGATIMQQVETALEVSKGNNVSYPRSASGFSGFQTASGQCVKLSKTALEKGVSIMQQIDKSLEESNGSNKSSRSANGFSGFQTASGQRIKPSDKALEKGASIIKQIDKSLEESKGSNTSYPRKTSGFSGFKTASGQRVKISKESLDKGVKIMQQIKTLLEESKGKSASYSPSVTDFSGFQTASGQSVKLSKEALEKGTSIMQQIDKSLEESKDSNKSYSKSTSGFSGFQTASGQSVKLSKEALEKGASIMQQIDKSLEESKGSNTSYSRSTNGFSGFQTVSGQRVKQSDEALKKGASIIRQIDESLEESKGSNTSNPRKTSGFSGFKTASGQSVKMSKESLQKGAKIMQEVDKSLEENKGKSVFNSPSATDFSGFQTASRQCVKLSKEALEKGPFIMQQIDKFPEESKDINISYSSGFTGGESVKMSKESLGKGMKIMKETDKSLEEKVDKGEPSRTSVPGFLTAAGKSVQVSDSALAKARETMASIDSELRLLSSETGNPQFQTVPEGDIASRALFIKVKGVTTPSSEARSFAEHDKAVSREILESSEALLADESFMDVSDYLLDREEYSDDGRTSVSASRSGSSSVERERGKRHEGKTGIRRQKR